MSKPETSAEPVAFASEIVGELLGRKRLIAGCVAAALAVAVLYLVTAPKLYEARLVIMPNQQTPNGSLSSLAGLAGVDLLASKATNFSLFMATLDSARLVDRMEAKEGLIRDLNAANWDAQHGRWVAPGGTMQAIKGAVWGLFGLPAWTPPSSRTVAEELAEKVRKIKDRDTNTITLSYQSRDKELAGKVVGSMYAEAEAMIRDDQLAQANQSVDYLTQRLQQVTTNEYRETLFKLLADQERSRVMLQNTNIPIAAINVDPVTVSDRPVSPRPVVVFLVAVVAGVFAAAVIVLLQAVGIETKARARRRRDALSPMAS